MADEAGAAQAITETHLAAALRQHRAAQPAAPSDGVCRNCGEAIAPARLAVMPTARLCIACASR